MGSRGEGLGRAKMRRLRHSAATLPATIATCTQRLRRTGMQKQQAGGQEPERRRVGAKLLRARMRPGAAARGCPANPCRPRPQHASSRGPPSFEPFATMQPYVE